MARDRIAPPDLSHHEKAVAITLAREIRTKPRPGIAAVRALEEIVRAEIDRVVIIRRDEHWRAPIPPVRLAPEFREWLDRFLFTGAHIVTHDVTTLRFAINGVRIGGIDLRIEAVAPRRANPVSVADALTIPCLARSAPAAVVLQPAVHEVERLAHVGGDGVVLRDGKVRDECGRGHG